MRIRGQAQIKDNWVCDLNMIWLIGLVTKNKLKPSELRYVPIEYPLSSGIKKMSGTNKLFAMKFGLLLICCWLHLIAGQISKLNMYDIKHWACL